MFDSEGRRIAEYNAGTGALIREYVWKGWDAIAVIDGVVSLTRSDHIGCAIFATNTPSVARLTATPTSRQTPDAYPTETRRLQAPDFSATP